MQQDHAARPTIIRLDGAFDRAAFGRIQQALAGVRAGEQVLVDLSKAREIDDYSVAALAEWANTTPGRVEFRGLRQHQLRLLRYFGMASAAL